MTSTNWGGNYRYLATQIHQPTSLSELRSVIASATNIRVLGSRHSFTNIADANELVSLDALPELFEFDATAMTVRVNANMTYGRFAELAAPHQVALHNVASLPHITIAGAIATATHGSGTRNGNLATAVVALEMINGRGETVTTASGDPDWNGIVVGLGALGVVTAVTLRVEPHYDIAQYVFESMDWQDLTNSFDDIFAAGHSVSVFSGYGRAIESLWIKCRTTDPRRSDYIGDEFYGSPRATQRRHPIIALSAENCTVQQGIAGPWAERLPHFQMAFSPSAGDEIQSEFFVPIEFSAQAIAALRSIASQIQQVLLVSEIRTVAADEFWMSPQYGQTTTAFHFTWRLDEQLVAQAASVVADALAPFQVRPHWGKVFPAGMPAVAQFARRQDFLDLVGRLDPDGVFANSWMHQHLGS